MQLENFNPAIQTLRMVVDKNGGKTAYLSNALEIQLNDPIKHGYLVANWPPSEKYSNIKRDWSLPISGLLESKLREMDEMNQQQIEAHKEEWFKNTRKAPIVYKPLVRSTENGQSYMSVKVIVNGPRATVIWKAIPKTNSTALTYTRGSVTDLVAGAKTIIKIRLYGLWFEAGNKVGMCATASEILVASGPEEGKEVCSKPCFNGIELEEAEKEEKESVGEQQWNPLTQDIVPM